MATSGTRQVTEHGHRAGPSTPKTASGHRRARRRIAFTLPLPTLFPMWTISTAPAAPRTDRAQPTGQGHRAQYRARLPFCTTVGTAARPRSADGGVMG